MEDLIEKTSELKENLGKVNQYEVKEDIIFRHIRSVENLNYTVEEFPSNLDWFNTSEPLTDAHLRGKIVVLDFFTYCCINCLHIIPHLRELEENFSVADGLVVIGVHSAKFDNERDSQNILLALKKYNISHPVVNDKCCHMWSKLDISCWPTIMILGPQRQPLFVLIGENHREELLVFVKVALKFYKNSISPHRLPSAPCYQIITSTLLNFPGKITRWGNLYAVSDSGNHRIVIFDGATNYVKFYVGGKNAGFKDGSFEAARFNSPQGLTFYDSGKLYVADTGNHAIRLVNLDRSNVTTVVGNGKQGTDQEGGREGTHQEISSPWDVCVVPCSDVEVPSIGWSRPPDGLPPLPPPPPPPPSGQPPPPPLPSFGQSSGDCPSSAGVENSCKAKVLLIAAAGTHQIWAYFIEAGVWWKGKEYERNVCVAVAGSGKEENRNSRYPMAASFAQPSGLAYSKELKSVFVADSESSSVRKLSLRDGSVSHVAGGGSSPKDLFSYGDADGTGHDAKLQHPLAVVWSSKEKSLYICDTYNHRIKKIHCSGSSYSGCSSVHKSRELFREPGGACLNESEDLIYVCDTNNNCVKTVNVSDGGLKELKIQDPAQMEVETGAKDVWELETSLSKAGGTLTLRIRFTPEEIHGKWRLQAGEAKIKVVAASGKLTSNVAEFVLTVLPSPVDDVFQIHFDLVLCGTETCSYKKLSLEVRVRRVEGGEERAVREVSKGLE